MAKYIFTKRTRAHMYIMDPDGNLYCIKNRYFRFSWFNHRGNVVELVWLWIERQKNILKLISVSSSITVVGQNCVGLSNLVYIN